MKNTIIRLRELSSRRFRGWYSRLPEGAKKWLSQKMNFRLSEEMKKWGKITARKSATGALVTLVSAAAFVAYAAFTEPTSAPSASTQDFLQNILGANNADNAFDSSSVAANADGSLAERMEYISQQINVPAESVVKVGTSYGVGNNGSLTPVSGAASSLTATASDVVIGKIFFGSGDTDWTPTAGTYQTFSSYENQKNQIWDDWKGGASSTNQGLAYAYANNLDENIEEAAWSSTTDSNLNGANVASGSVKKDTRANLYWSDAYDSTSGGGSPDQVANNNFTLNGVIDDADDGLDAEGGTAVDFCEALSLDATGDGNDETDWYLPSQKELMQAYIDGAANNILDPAYNFWSSTEYYSPSTNAWHVYLHNGYTSNNAKSTATYYVRCVRR